MAVKAGTAYVGIEGDFSGLNKQVSSHFARITKNADKAGHKIGKSFGVGMAAGVGAAVVAGKQFFDFGKDAVNTASDINESLSKNRVLFGKYAKGIEGFSNRSADAFGISKQAALEYTGTFGNLFTALGVSNKQSAKFSTNLTKLSADMASFNNTSIEDALEAIRSGLVGETEPLRKFGVNINQTALEAEALSSGLVKTHADQGKMKTSTLALDIAQRNLGKAVKEHGVNSIETKKAQLGLEKAQQGVIRASKGGKIQLTAEQKALAAQNLIIKQTAKAHGDFQRTSEQLANQQRRLTARWADAKNTLGTALLPAVKNVTTELIHLADDVQPKVERAVKGISKIFASKDMSLGDKFKASLTLVKFNFGPLTNKIGQGLKDANLDNKLEEVILWAAPKVEAAFLKVGQRSAQTWWKGFREDPLWTAVGTGFIAAKLGLTGPLLKGLMSLFSGKGGGGLFSKATPMPVYVVNAGGLPGLPGGKPGGPGAPVPTGALGKLGRLKPLLKLGGKLGAAGAAIDLGINLIDQKGNPINALVNTASDLTFGIIPRVKTATDEAAKKVSQIKVKLPVDVQSNLSPGFDQKMIDLQKQIDSRTQSIRARTAAAAPQLAAAAPGAGGPIVMALTRANAGDQAAIAAAGKQMGKLYAENYVAGINEHHEFFGADELTKGFSQQLQALPQAARQQALNTMTNWANTLVQQGRLPKSALGTIITDIKGQFNLLPTGIQDPTRRGVDAVTRQFQRRDMIDAANKQLAELKHTYGQFPDVAQFNGKNMSTNFITEINALQSQASTATGKLKTKTEADLKAVRAAAIKYGHQANGGLNDELKDAGIKGSRHARKIRDDIVLAFTQMASGTGGMSEKTANTLYTALENMGVNAAAILTSLGLKVPSLKLTKMQKQGKGAVSGTVAAQHGRYIGGSGTGDKIPAMLEPGEYVVNRKAVKRIGRAALDRLNFSDAPRFQKGGSVTGDTDFLPTLMNALRALSGSVGVPISVQSGRRTVAEQLAQGPSTPSHPVAGVNGPHVRGVAADITPGYSVFGKAAGRFGLGFTVMPQEPWHIQLIDAAAAGASAAVQKVARLKISGPDGALVNSAQAIVDKSRGAYNKYIVDQMASVVPGGEGAPTGGAAGSLSKAQLKSLWTRAGGPPGVANVAAAIALAESGGIPSRNNADRPGDGGHSIAAGLWQILGLPFEGNVYDPMTNARMAVSKYNSAGGFSPWEAYTKGSYSQYLQRGGSLLKRFKTGGSTYKAPKTKALRFTNDAVTKFLDRMVASKPVFTNSRKINALSKSLKDIGYDRSVFDNLSGKVDIDAQWADVASDLTDTTAITDALQLELEKRQAAMTVEQRTKLLDDTKNMLPSQQAKYVTEQIFPEAAQKAIVDSMQGRVQGFTQLDWLNQELGDMLGLRNLIIVDTPTVQSAIADVVKKINQAKALSAHLEREIARIEKEIQAFIDKRNDVNEERKNIADAIKPEQDAFDKAQRDLAAEHKKKHPSQSKIKSLSDSISGHRKHLDNLHYRYDVLTGGTAKQIADATGYGDKRPYAHKHWHSMRYYTEHLAQDRLDNRRNTSQKKRLDDKVIPAYEDRKDKLTTADSDLHSNLIDLQGTGTIMDLLPVLPPLGVLAGKIHQVTMRRNDLTEHPTRINAEMPSAPPENPADEILRQLARDANLRTAVSEAQFDVFKNLPFGGSFKEGGTVPGPYGAPRMILAHGGEVVIPNDASNAPNVSLHFANGMEWLKQFVDVRVDNQTRAQGRRSERQLPGRAGTLR